MYKIAAMGDKDSIYGFASLGISIFPVTDPAEGAHTLRKLADNGYGVIYIGAARRGDARGDRALRLKAAARHSSRARCQGQYGARA